MIDFAIAERTQLRQKGELNQLFGVSYPMTNAYMRDKSYPRGKNRLHITVVMEVLGELLKSGKLPLPDDESTEKRAAAVEKIKECINNAKQA